MVVNDLILVLKNKLWSSERALNTISTCHLTTLKTEYCSFFLYKPKTYFKILIITGRYVLLIIPDRTPKIKII